MKSISISFETQQLPPPFAYAGITEMEFTDNQVVVSHSREYLDREGISLEEILEEGFSENDDFSWEGQLGPVWKNAISTLLSETEFTEAQPEYGNLVHLKTEVDKGYAANVAAWEYLLEELQQCLLELQGTEAPFQLDVFKDGSMVYSVVASFATRSFECNGQEKPWESLKKLLLSLESLELHEAVSTRPNSKGFSITMDGKNYYRVTGKDSVQELQDSLENLT